MKVIAENVGLRISKSIKVYQVDKQLLTNEYHIHNEIEIALIVKGHGVKIVGGTISKYHEWDLSIYGSNLAHSYISQKSDEPQQSLIIQFSPQVLNLEIPEFSNINTLITKANLGIEYDEATAKKMYKTMLKMKKQRGLNNYLALIKLLENLAKESNFKIISKTISQPNKDERIIRVIEYMKENYAQKIDIQECAKVAKMSVSGFRSLFFKENQMSPIRYLIDLRISQACRKLSESNEQIIDIAYECGFENLSNFNRHFRKLIGIQPMRYRNLHK